MRRLLPDLADFSLIVGAALVVAGIAVIYWPAALIVAGLMLVTFAVRRPDGNAR
jgi:hypothetical protein